MKNNNLIKTVFFTFLIIVSTNVFSQSDFSFHFGGAFPMGNFGSNDFDNSHVSGAGTGFNVGMRFNYQLNENGLGIFCEANFNYNGLQSDYKYDLDDYLGDYFHIPSGADITYPKFLNFPISAGLSYILAANDKMSLFCSAGLAVNFCKTTDYIAEYHDIEGKISADMMTSLGFKIGGGILLNNKVSIEVNYFGLGSPDLKTKIKIGEDGEFFTKTETLKGKDIAILNLTVGFRF